MQLRLWRSACLEINAMTTTTYQPKCARCNVTLESSVPDPEPKDHVACPTCGEGDTLENVTREIGEYITEKMTESLGDTFRNLERNSGGMIKVTTSHSPHRIYRFIVDYEA